MRYNETDWPAAEAQIKRDAEQITSGACNPVAVSGVVHDMLAVLRRHGQPLDHPAALVTLSHLTYLLCRENVAADAWLKFYAEDLVRA